MSDTSDNLIICATVNDPNFQERCRLRFINSALQVVGESSSVTNHAQRLEFAGALFANTVDARLLPLLVLCSSINRANALSGQTPQNISPGGVILDSDIDAQVGTVFNGVAISRAW